MKYSCLLVPLVMALASCSFIPGTTVRVALPPGDARAKLQWATIVSVLPRIPGEVPVDLVAPALCGRAVGGNL